MITTQRTPPWLRWLPGITAARPPAPAGARPNASSQQAWKIPTLVDEDPGREAYTLLGSAWHSSTARLVQTGHDFDVVRVPQPHAASALEALRSGGARRGAVSAEGGCWHFFVPMRSGSLAWPPWVTYLSGPSVQIPPRAARDNRLSLRWITRGEPLGLLLTESSVLCPILTALSPPDPRSGP
uniref:Uncharacterized protein n=1 Tax=Streptomyces sp. FR1 TaxID=349971 RepID=V9Z0M9_9ACTN|nr:hypothetical protein [Streptomyces sp. FR1]AHE39140.1 Hypothetical protein pFRL3_363c [Streptomyces sp. FR1]